MPRTTTASISESATASSRARRLRAAGLSAALLLAVCAPLGAEEVYLAPDRFVAEAFGGDAPPGAVVWLTGPLAREAESILGHPPRALRARYWRRDGRTAWVLEEIGKEAPITAGFVIEDGALARVRVLVYRETRGWEIRHAFFTAQFDGARLRVDSALDRRIDNIAGATLSVGAMQRMARLALRLHQQVAGESS